MPPWPIAGGPGSDCHRKRSGNMLLVVALMRFFLGEMSQWTKLAQTMGAAAGDPPLQLAHILPIRGGFSIWLVMFGNSSWMNGSRILQPLRIARLPVESEFSAQRNSSK